MESVTGIFRSLNEAQQSLEELVRRDMSRESLVLLTSQNPEGSTSEATRELDQVRTETAPSQGEGKRQGAAIGATIGGTAGFTAAATVAGLTVPGLGLVFAIGLGAAAVLGLGAAAAGAKLGETVENNIDTGVPAGRVELYRELLRRGYSLVIANVRSGAETSMAREVFQNHGSEDWDRLRGEIGKAA